MHVTVNRKQATVSVADDRPWAFPMPTEPAALCVERAQEGGRGLMLVDSLARAWGFTVYGGRSPRLKAVWFTLAEVETEAEVRAESGETG